MRGLESDTAAAYLPTVRGKSLHLSRPESSLFVNGASGRAPVREQVIYKRLGTF